ncbi:uncharacterized protein LOC126161337 [Schistocerca cancellata]|uniref:uncharacterized protein LOC126161337 n=1 Tax=Schistocerca cancellata TaxID=274614 RepID=UPI0021177E26|nr:uncharacterized protein LOC126161337 [Schistocerca cancellata]
MCCSQMLPRRAKPLFLRERSASNRHWRILRKTLAILQSGYPLTKPLILAVGIWCTSQLENSLLPRLDEDTSYYAKKWNERLTPRLLAQCRKHWACYGEVKIRNVGIQGFSHCDG